MEICGAMGHFADSVVTQTSVMLKSVENQVKCLDPRGGGGTLIFSYIRRLGPFFGGQISEFNIFLGFQKNEYILGMKILWIFFWGHPKIGLVLGVISMYLRVFS